MSAGCNCNPLITDRVSTTTSRFNSLHNYELNIKIPYTRLSYDFVKYSCFSIGSLQSLLSVVIIIAIVITYTIIRPKLMYRYAAELPAKPLSTLFFHHRVPSRLKRVADPVDQEKARYRNGFCTGYWWNVPGWMPQC